MSLLTNSFLVSSAMPPDISSLSKTRGSILPLKLFQKRLPIISTITTTVGFKRKQNGCLPLNSGKHPFQMFNFSLLSRILGTYQGESALLFLLFDQFLMLFIFLMSFCLVFFFNFHFSIAILRPPCYNRHSAAIFQCFCVVYTQIFVAGTVGSVYFYRNTRRYTLVASGW